jgi:hypothetical protein
MARVSRSLLLVRVRPRMRTSMPAAAGVEDVVAQVGLVNELCHLF